MRMMEWGMGGRTDACGVFPGVCIRQCRLFEMIPILTVKKGLGEFIEANGAQKRPLRRKVRSVWLLLRHIDIWIALRLESYDRRAAMVGQRY
jgi:hypothetical protein